MSFPSSNNKYANNKGKIFSALTRRFVEIAHSVSGHSARKKDLIQANEELPVGTVRA